MFVGVGPSPCWLCVAKVMTGICPKYGLYCWHGEAWWLGSRSHNQDQGEGRGGVHVAAARRSYREGGKVRHENLGNLSHLPAEIIDVIRAMLAGRRLVDLDEDFEIKRSLPHGHVAAVLGVLRGLDLERLLGRDRCRERDLVVAMICQRLIGPGSKLSATRRFDQTTLGDELSLGEVKEAELMAAMDWLVDRQPRIERTLARRHLPSEGNGNAFVVYDLSSSYMEGRVARWRRSGTRAMGSRASCRSTTG